MVDDSGKHVTEMARHMRTDRAALAGQQVERRELDAVEPIRAPAILPIRGDKARRVIGARGQVEIDEAREAGRRSVLMLIRRGGEPLFVALPLSETAPADEDTAPVE